MKTICVTVTEPELQNFSLRLGVSLRPEEDPHLVALKSLLIQKGARFRPSFSREFADGDLLRPWTAWRCTDAFGDDYLKLIQTTYEPATSTTSPTA